MNHDDHTTVTEALVLEGRNTGLAREGTAKLVRQTGQSDELYDLVTDTGEKHDLAIAKFEATGQLGNTVDAGNKELAPPAFAGLGARKQGKAKARQKQGATP